MLYSNNSRVGDKTPKTTWTIMSNKTLRQNIETLFRDNVIETKQQLDEWCGGSGREKLHTYLKHNSCDWHELLSPKQSVSAIYQTMLEGYKRFNPNTHKKINGEPPNTPITANRLSLERTQGELERNPPLPNDDDESDEELTEEEFALVIANAKKKKKAQKVALKSAEETKRLRQVWFSENGYDDIKSQIEALQVKAKELEAKNPHKVSFRVGNKRHAEGTEKRAELDKRYKANWDPKHTKKNLFCHGGDGVNGTPEFRAGGKKITGCAYCCRSRATMDKHEAKCKKYNP